MEPSTEATKPKRHARRNKKPRAATRKPSNEYTGLTVTDCANACNADGCVISGRNYCGHPAKGGLQGRDMGDPIALGRLTAARKILGKKKLALG